MRKVYPGATITPRFGEFLPGWVARQPWYAGTGTPELSPVGYFRFEDPAGEVGIETHLTSDGSALYQIPMTYRDAPLDGAEEALITTTEHSVLGTRWIYDAVVDPVWAGEVLRIAREEGTSDPSSKTGVGPAQARGTRLAPGKLTDGTAGIELRRVLTEDHPGTEPGVVAVITGTWHPRGSTAAAVTGCLAVLRATA